MLKAEKKVFIYCSLFLIIWMAFVFFFSEQHQTWVTFLKEKQTVFERWRTNYNSLIKNIERAFELNDFEYEQLVNTSYTMIYKREYENLKEYLSITDKMDLTKSIHTTVLINTYGTRDAEILRIISDDPIPQKGFLISPSLSSVIGKIQKVSGNTAEIIPIWNQQFTAQVMVRDNESQVDYPDLALIEDKQVVNFNPAFPYNVGDGIYISVYEPGGYNLSNYEWTRIGKIGPVKQNEIVEKYGIEYDYTREKILEERYFLIVE